MKPFTGYRCDHCNKPYASKGAAAIHERKCPQDIINHACATCRYSTMGDGETDRKIRYCGRTNAPALEIHCPLWELE